VLTQGFSPSLDVSLHYSKVLAIGYLSIASLGCLCVVLLELPLMIRLAFLLLLGLCVRGFLRQLRRLSLIDTLQLRNEKLHILYRPWSGASQVLARDGNIFRECFISPLVCAFWLTFDDDKGPWGLARLPLVVVFDAVTFDDHRRIRIWATNAKRHASAQSR